MSVLDRVREKFQMPMSGTSKASISPSAGSAGSLTIHPKIDAACAVEPNLDSPRNELLRMLNARPEIKRAFIAEPLPNGGGLVRLAVRDIGTCELLIPDGRFDPLAILKLFDELGQESGARN